MHAVLCLLWHFRQFQVPFSQGIQQQHDGKGKDENQPFPDAWEIADKRRILFGFGPYRMALAGQQDFHVHHQRADQN